MKDKIDKILGWIVVAFFVLMAIELIASGALAHDIYNSVHGKNGQLCCGGSPVTGDCAPVVAEVHGVTAVFFIRPRRIRQSYANMSDTQVRVPVSFVTFLPVPGQEQQDDVPVAGPGQIIGHFCGRPETFKAENVFDGWLVYCAFLDPGAT